MILAIIPILILILFGFSIGILLTPISIMIKDIMRALPFLMQFLMYLFPVIYPVPIRLDTWTDTLLFKNPLAIVLCDARTLLTTSNAIDYSHMLILLCVSFMLFVVANFIFKVSQTHITSRLGS